ncbi:MAG: hypothetical protein A4E25_00055 [Methanobacterium sp. PtaB.Bin024]|nr:MAG: hypothetical protein A4E25_00055 [Methanobacterium sp. PtaB.Bin024]
MLWQNNGGNKLIVDENKLLEHLKELGLSDEGIDETVSLSQTIKLIVLDAFEDLNFESRVIKE